MKLRAILVIAALSLPPFGAVADEAEPVIVLVAGRDSAFANRVSAELESIGFRVVTEVDANASPRERTVAVARIIDGTDRRIEVRPSADVAGTNDAPIVIEAGSADNVSSVQVSERIRAYFQPLHERVAPPSVVPPPPPAPSIAPAPQVVPAEPPGAPSTPVRPARSWSAGIGAGLSVPFDTGGVGLGALVAFYALPLRWLRLSPFVSVPLLATRVDGKGGSASLYTGMLGATVDFGLVDTHSVALFAGAGYGGVWLRAVGHAQTGFTGTTADGRRADSWRGRKPFRHFEHGRERRSPGVEGLRRELQVRGRHGQRADHALGRSAGREGDPRNARALPATDGSERGFATSISRGHSFPGAHRLDGV